MTPPAPPSPPPPPSGSGSSGPPGYGGAAVPSGPRAGFWIRFAAAVIDAILVGIVGNILQFATGVLFIGLAVSTLLGFVYYGYFEGGPSGQTIGKKVLNIRVARMADGGPLGWSTALLRHLCSYVSGLPCGLGYLWMLWDPEKMTWHDKLSQTVVVPTDAWPPPPDSFGKPPES